MCDKPEQQIAPAFTDTVASRRRLWATTMADEEERLLETQLEQQLQEQRDSFSALKDALASDPSNPDLLAVRPF